ncbi:CACNA1I [Symbiodinium necroappetens]|uniref:CACNA1I protein n=1 Tax=Symbiodinium necroappetens TaxID=1628268 RepID=A0A813A638_9DINO|nr:CACNA1I [Symbiodinium necroappetens]
MDVAAGRRPSSQSSSQTSKTASVRPSSQPVRSASLPALARPVIEAQAGHPRNLVPVPHQERGTGPGACICDRRLFPPKSKVVKPCECQRTCTCGAGQYLPPFAQRGKICLCRKSKGNVYNAEVYSALQTRGGALWERLGSEARSLREREGFEKRMQKPSLQACQLCMRHWWKPTSVPKPLQGVLVVNIATIESALTEDMPVVVLNVANSGKTKTRFSTAQYVTIHWWIPRSVSKLLPSGPVVNIAIILSALAECVPGI